MFGDLGGLADIYSAQFDAARRQAMQGIGGQAAGLLGQSLGYRESEREILARKSKLSIKDELQDEVDEWLKDTI